MKYALIISFALMSFAHASGIQCTGKSSQEKFLFYSTTNAQYELLHIKVNNGFDQIVSKMKNADFELGTKNEGSFEDVTQVTSNNTAKGLKYNLFPKKGIVSIKTKKSGVTKRITNLECRII